ncbi:MAG: hypothetical protein J6B12_05215, partial [Clostridia bacterium]|nr:hypothetical protein [Clostridia bacterium]
EAVGACETKAYRSPYQKQQTEAARAPTASQSLGTSLSEGGYSVSASGVALAGTMRWLFHDRCK